MLRTATSRGLALRRLTCSSRASTNRSDLVVAPSAHGLTAETVVVALEGTKTIKHSKRMSAVELRCREFSRHSPHDRWTDANDSGRGAPRKSRGSNRTLQCPGRL